MTKALGRGGGAKAGWKWCVCIFKESKGRGSSAPRPAGLRGGCWGARHTYLGSGCRADPGQRWRVKSNCLFKPYLSHQWFSSIQGKNDFVQN